MSEETDKGQVERAGRTGTGAHQRELADIVLTYVVDATHGPMVERDAFEMAFGISS